jgi:hypothetical protein
MPSPRGTEDIRKVRMHWRKLQHFAGGGGVSHQMRGITRPPRLYGIGHLSSGLAFNGR